MKLEQQVTNLELAKKLKKLGVNQESLFYWHLESGHYFVVGDNKLEDEDSRYLFSAFTVAELGEMLPEIIKVDHNRVAQFYCYRLDKERVIQLEAKERPIYEGSIVEYGFYKEMSADTEANARAKMLIYLLENKLIK